MKKVSEYSKTFLGIVAVLTVVGGGMVALGFGWSSPAENLEAHIEVFDHHVDDFATYLDLEDLKQESRAQRTSMMEAQTRVMCYETEVSTLALAGLIATCDSLGVRR